MKKRNWKESGLLEGLKPEHAEIVENYYNKINEERFTDNNTAKDIMVPIIRRIVTQIIDSENVPYPDSYLLQECLINPDFAYRGVTKENALNEVNVDEITELVLDYARTFIPVAEAFLPDLDAQAEMTLLFCRDYQMKILYRLCK
jgi:hypothetical protein